MSNAIKDLGVGAAIGYGASMAMDRATDWYLGHQCKESRLREEEEEEEEVAPGGAPVLVGKKLAGLVGRGVSDENAAKIGTMVHRALGMTYGVTAAALSTTGVPPLVGGIATGTAAFVVVDEAFLSAVFTPPWAYPIESHVRGVVGHLAYGTVTGAMLTAVRRLGAVSR
jgi:hypothetical protein